MCAYQLQDLKPRYQELFASCQVRSSWLAHIQELAQKIVSLRPQYYQAIQDQTSVPWWFIGILHYRDLGFNTNSHLHNGDPLIGRTDHDPVGRPVANPANGFAYTFVESAVDALRYKTYDTTQDRSIAAWLWRFEEWNGWGYAMRGMNSEYLWNGTNHFGSGNNQGLFIADYGTVGTPKAVGQFDANAKSSQVGAAAILWYFHHKAMLDYGIEEAPTQTPMAPPDLAHINLSFVPNGLNGANGAVHEVAPSTNGTHNAIAMQEPPAVELLDVFKYYQRLPHQQAALEWLQQQQSPSVLAEFTRRWQEASAQVVTPFQYPAPTISNVSPVGTPPTSAPEIQHVAPEPLTLEQRIIAYCEEKNYIIDRGVGEKNIIYIEGMYPDGTLNDDAFNAWNDTRMVIEFVEDVPKIIGRWEATTEPGQYYTMRPMNAGGAARIEFGQYKAWIVGIHLNNHEALVQVAPLTVCRDLNKDGKRINDRRETGNFGVNQHWGGDAPKNDIGRWSAGCLVGRTRDGHREFMKIIKQDPRYQRDRGYVFRSIVIPGDDLFGRFPAG
jgi:lysozyme family protein